MDKHQIIAIVIFIFGTGVCLLFWKTPKDQPAVSPTPLATPEPFDPWSDESKQDTTLSESHRNCFKYPEFASCKKLKAALEADVKAGMMSSGVAGSILSGGYILHNNTFGTPEPNPEIIPQPTISSSTDK